MDDDNFPNDSRLAALSHDRDKSVSVNRAYSRFVRSMRIILPLIAVGMTAVVLTWDDAGRRMTPPQKETIAPQEDNIENELMKPVFNSVDEKKQPFAVTADRATQDRLNPDILNLDNPTAELTQLDGTKINADAKLGVYQQKEQKLNLSGDVHLKHSDGYVLSSEELRIDLVTQRAFSGLDVFVEGPTGTIQSTGLEGDAQTGDLIFTGPAKVVLYSEGLKLSPQEKTP